MNGFFHLHQFAGWINTTGAHTWARGLNVASQDRLLLAVQITHVLGICLVAGSVGVFSLRMAGTIGRGQPLATVARRLLPWAWAAILLQIATGLFMVIERPERAMDSLTFPYKMAFLVAAIIVTAVFGFTLRADPNYWDRDGNRRAVGRALGTVSLVLWVGVIFAGRWIAYERVPA